MRLSISKMKAFKSCRRMYELKYQEGLYPVNTADALETGKNYHKRLERLYNGDFDALDDDYSKECAMAIAYHKYIYPKFRVVETEKWIEYDLGSGNKLVGQIDAVAENGMLVEHKTYGGNDSFEQYEYNLMWDEQILAYMFMTGQRKMYYTVCKKPTIRIKKGETEEEFFARMVAWYDEDTDSKIRLIMVQRTDEDVARFEDELMLMVNEMMHTEHYYRNPCNCNMYGRRCEYSSICMNYDPEQTYIEFERREEYEPEEN